MPSTRLRSRSRSDSDAHNDLAAWLVAVHHEIGNHLAAVRFAAQLAGEDPGQLRSTAQALDRAAMQAGSLLALARPLLVVDAPELETMRVETLFESIRRELLAQGQPAPGVEIEAGLPPLRVCLEALHPAMTAIALRNETAQPVLLRAALDKGAVLVQLESRVKWSAPQRERALVLQMVERLMDRCEIPFAVREADVFNAEFWCEAAL
jgi:hypothetical protein